MASAFTYTINEAAALTGRHPNTIRQKIRLGQLEASVEQGKYGEEYRIPHAALVRAGLLAEEGPHVDAPSSETVFDAEFVAPEERVGDETGPPPADGVPETGTSVGAGALAELFQRHEHAMFRLGYLQGELERVKALAETAESLRQDRDSRERELETLRTELEQSGQHAIETEALRAELEQARRRLAEMNQLRDELESLKKLADEQERRLTAAIAPKPPRWQFWRRS